MGTDPHHITKHVPLERGWSEWCAVLQPEGRCLWDYGAKVFSQNGEDGILHRIFSEIGTTCKHVVEIGAGDGIECMAANLVINHGFTATLFDGSADRLAIGRQEYGRRGILDRASFNHAWITRENIVDVLERSGACAVTGECDLLSLDIDGVDYYVLKAIMDAGTLRPRVLVLEYQDILGPNSTHTVVYDPVFDHTAYDCWNGPNYCGASLGAFRYLLKDAYAFVGCEAAGFNAFFVRRDLLTEYLSEMEDVTACFGLPKVAEGMRTRAPRTAHMHWVDVRTL